MTTKSVLSILVLAVLCGCSHDPEPYHLEVNGVRAHFCVPEMHRVHLPFGFPETDPERDSGFAFVGCQNMLESTGECLVPGSVSGGTVGPLVDAVHWKWKDFSPGSEYHEALGDLAAKNIDDVRIFDRGRMLRVVTASNLANVFFWARPSNQQFADPPELHAKDQLVAVCQRPGFNYKDPQRPVDPIQCERYTTSAQYSLSYNFSMDRMSIEKVHELDHRLFRAIDRWKCNSADSGTPPDLP